MQVITIICTKKNNSQHSHMQCGCLEEQCDPLRAEQREETGCSWSPTSGYKDSCTLDTDTKIHGLHKPTRVMPTATAAALPALPGAVASLSIWNNWNNWNKIKTIETIWNKFEKILKQIETACSVCRLGATRNVVFCKKTTEIGILSPYFRHPVCIKLNSLSIEVLMTDFYTVFAEIM